MHLLNDFAIALSEFCLYLLKVCAMIANFKLKSFRF